MNIVERDIWEAHAEGKVIVVPTNGTTRADNSAVMGRGVAKQAAERFPTFQAELGRHLRCVGNHAAYWPQHRVVTFPVKTQWWEKAFLLLIQRSAKEIRDVIRPGHPDIFPLWMPRVGCGNGRLSWDAVGPVIESILGDLVVIVQEPVKKGG